MTSSMHVPADSGLAYHFRRVLDPVAIESALPDRPAYVPATAISFGSAGWMAAVMSDDEAGIQWWWSDMRGSMVSLIDDELAISDARSIAPLAMLPSTPREWNGIVMPKLLASDALDAMTKLRLAARWAEAKA